MDNRRPLSAYAGETIEAGLPAPPRRMDKKGGVPNG